jgi:hypothetical protein
VEAQFPVGLLRPLVAAAGGPGGDVPTARGVMGLEARVRLDAGTHTVDWPARVARVAGSIDPQTQSLGVVVAVSEPYAQAQPGQRPPLYRNTFVQVELHGRPLADRLIAPRAALHQGRIYVIDDENRLAIRPVRVEFTQGSFVVLAEGVLAGQRIVVSDLVPAVPGMLLDAQDDLEIWQALAAEATGGAGAP